MDPQDTIDFSREALTMVAILGGPILAAGLVIGLIVGIFQAMTQIQDQTVSAVPKMLGMLLVTIIVLPWLSDSMVDYTRATLSTPRIGAMAPMVPVEPMAPVAAVEPSPYQLASATTHVVPVYNGGPVGGIANVPPVAPPAQNGMPTLIQTTTMPAMEPVTTSMPIHPYGQSLEADPSALPRLQHRDLLRQSLKDIEL